MAVVAALISSNDDVPLPEHAAFAAEVGLSGEIRPVSKIDFRIAEAEKLGYTTIFISKYNTLEKNARSIKIVRLSKIAELYHKLFSG